MPQYVFDIAADTPNQRINPDVMAQQLTDAAYASGGVFEGMFSEGGEAAAGGVIDASTVPGTFTVQWQNALDPGDEAAQAALVAAHQGDPFGDIVQRVGSESMSSTSSATPQVKVEGTAQPLPAGKYLIALYCEIRLSAAVANSGVEATLEWERGGNPPNQLAEDTWGEAQWHAFSGAGIVDINAGDTPTLRLLFRRIGVANTVEIRRARLSISQQSD